MLDSALAVQVATDEYRPAAGVAGGIDVPTEQADILTEHVHRAAGLACAGS